MPTLRHEEAFDMIFFAILDAIFADIEIAHAGLCQDYCHFLSFYFAIAASHMTPLRVSISIMLPLAICFSFHCRRF